MSGAPSSDIRPVVVGLSHRSSPAALRDRAFVEDAEMSDFLAELRAAGIAQAIVLSTCDRVEVQGASADPGAFAQAVLGLLAKRVGLEAADLGAQASFASGDEALRQIFAVASALDSQVVGEPQVLGQVKEAHRRSRDAGLIGPELETALQAAYGAAKRVRSETAVGERPVTLASAAVQVARDVHGDLHEATCLVVGAGEMGELLVDHLRSAALKHVAVTAANPSRAAALARQIGGQAVPFEPLSAALAAADIVIAAAGAGRYLVHRDDVDEALRQRRRRAMLLLDLGVPADIAPAVETLDGAFRYDLDDLERVALSGRVSREQAAAEAWQIVEAELRAFSRDRAGRHAVPAITALRRHFEAHRARVLAEAGGDAVRATELLINRLLHDPSEALRRLASAANDPAAPAALEKMLHELFGLTRDDGAAPDQETKT